MASIGNMGAIIVGGGVVESAFSYSSAGGGTLTAGTAAYPVAIFTFLSPTAVIQMGTSPSAVGAINIGSVSNAAIVIGGTARIVGSSSNGLAIRNSGNTRDNLLIADTGTSCLLGDGTRIGGIVNNPTSGERTSGTYFTSTSNSGGVWLGGGAANNGIKIGCVYFDGTQYRSAAEVANVASGFGTLSLMKSGGVVQLGAGAPTVPVLLQTQASATGGAGLNLPHGSAPTSPVNGDVWTTTAGMFVRINGVTVGPLT